MTTYTYPGVDYLTYTGVTASFTVSGDTGDTGSTGNFYGVSNSNTDTPAVNIFEISGSINTFTNNYSILGGGGRGGVGGSSNNSKGNGGHAINIATSDVTVDTLNNYGALLGGGGGGVSNYNDGKYCYGGAGGGGAGGGEYGSSPGGSIVSHVSAGSGSINGGDLTTYNIAGTVAGTGGGGPSGNGGNIDGGNIDGGRGSWFGGIGGQKYGILSNYGTFGGNGGTGIQSTDTGQNGGNAAQNLYNLAFGGGGGSCNEYYYSAGGGGYGGGAQGGVFVYYGGGGGGGGPPYGGGGSGGYSIYNSGTITNLNNAQGGTVQTITGVTGAVMFPYGPLFLGGTGVIGNYNMIITDQNNYGQLWYTGWGASGSLGLTGSTGFTVSLSDGFVDFQGTNIFYLVLVNVDLSSNTSGTITNSTNTYTYSWELITAPSVPLNDTTYTAYHLAVTNTSSLTNFYATTQVTGATGTNDLTKQFKFIPYYTS